MLHRKPVFSLEHKPPHISALGSMKNTLHLRGKTSGFETGKGNQIWFFNVAISVLNVASKAARLTML